VIIVTVYILAVLLFCVTFYLVKIINTCRQVLGTAHDAIAILSDTNLDDFAKERAIQKTALCMLKYCLILLMKVLTILGFTSLPVWLASIMNLATLDGISQFAMRWDVLIITTVIALLPVVLLRSGVSSNND
jgi:hypothetical protein